MKFFIICFYKFKINIKNLLFIINDNTNIVLDIIIKSDINK